MLSKIFFYGLYMDRKLLADRGLQPMVVGSAVLHDYRIHIGERATLLLSPGSRSYGIVMELSDRDATELYSEPSVREYVREPVRVELLDTGDVIEVDCYNLPTVAGTNTAYAVQLARLVESLRFEQAYVEEIAAFAKES